MKRINQMEPWIGEEEKQAINAYLDAGGWLTEFKKTREFEQMIADYTGSRFAVVVVNGTVSLTTAVMALGIGAGDQVLVPDFTMLASATALLLTGAEPVFVDVNTDDWCVDLDQVERAITPRTKALMLVSINGRSPDMARAVELCQRHNIHLIEDAAQSLGSWHKGKHLGTWGEIGSFSFSAPKVITTGQGGALVTDDPILAEKMRKIKDFGRRQAGEDFYETVGFNFKFTDLQSVIGIEQMKKLEWRVNRKKEMFRIYQQELVAVESVRFPVTNLAEVSPWFIDVLVPNPLALKQHLETKAIGSRLVYPALHSQPAFNLPGHFPGDDQGDGRRSTSV
jgi:perosamine synthetase